MKYPKLAFLIFFVLVFASCTDDDASVSETGDYFPFKNLEWKYKRSIEFAKEDGFQEFGSYTLRVTENVLANGKLYHRIKTEDDDYIDFETRRNGSQYFERNALFENNKEYKFLDTDKEVGETWSYSPDEHIRKIDYTVLAKRALQKINGVTYRNVITIGVDYYLPGDTGGVYLWMSAKHVYAEGVGEVYSIVPGPISLFYGNIESVRVND